MAAETAARESAIPPKLTSTATFAGAVDKQHAESWTQINRPIITLAQSAVLAVWMRHMSRKTTSRNRTDGIDAVIG